MFKLIRRIINLIIFTLILAVIFHNWTAKFALSAGLGFALGVPVKVEDVKIDFPSTSFLFQGIEIGNPATYPEGPLAVIPKLFIDVAVSSVWERKIHFETIDLDFQQLRVIRSRDGRFNLLSLKTAGKDSQTTQGRESGESGDNKEAISIPFQIDQMVLSLGSASYLDLASPAPAEKNFGLHLNRAVYQNVDGLEDIVKIISWETLKRIGLGNFAGMLGQWSAQWGESPDGFMDKARSAINTLRQKF